MTNVFGTGRRTFLGRPTHAEMRASVKTPADVQPALDASLLPDRDDEPGHMDDVAGCEFVDDRIHVTE